MLTIKTVGLLKPKAPKTIKPLTIKMPRARLHPKKPSLRKSFASKALRPRVALLGAPRIKLNNNK